MSLELDGRALYEALQQKRQQECLTRRDLVRLCGVTSPSITYLARGRSLSADSLLRAAAWLDRNPLDFAKQSGPPAAA
jgi:transcriptional regulator with XRE-family HTH domain